MCFWVERAMVNSPNLYRQPPSLVLRIRVYTLRKGILYSEGVKKLDSPKNKATKPTATVTPASLASLDAGFWTRLSHS